MIYDELQPIDFNQLKLIPDICSYCQRPFTDKNWRTLDHIIPSSKTKFHKNTRNRDIVCNNLIICCNECNQNKANLSLIEWLLKLDYYHPGRKEKNRFRIRENIKNSIRILLLTENQLKTLKQ